MFDLVNPPLLAQLFPGDCVAFFPESEGYQIHGLADGRILVSYRGGWTLPLSVAQQAHVAERPLLIVRDTGQITASTNTTTKGYAHIFCREDGQAPDYLLKQPLSPEAGHADWMFVPDTVTVIWFQYGNKTQYLGDTGAEIEQIYYGKLLIRAFSVREDVAPGFDKYADFPSRSARQLRVESSHVFHSDWYVINNEPEAYLRNFLAGSQLERYQDAVGAALAKSSGRKP